MKVDPANLLPLKPRPFTVGGLNGSELLTALSAAGIQLNDYARVLLSSAHFAKTEPARVLQTVELSVRELGCDDGATIDEIYNRAQKGGLQLCPLSLGPHMRLQYLDQPEGVVDERTQTRRAPPGSLTIASEWAVGESELPQGFYLRRIDGVLWLRGFCCDNEHLWDAEDRLVFCKE